MLRFGRKKNQWLVDLHSGGDPSLGSSSFAISPRAGKRSSLSLLKTSCPSMETSNRPWLPVLSSTPPSAGAQRPRISFARLTAWSR